MHAVEALIPISIFATFGLSLYYFTKTITDYILKKKMIDKGYVGEEAHNIFKNYNSANKFSSLKWGLLFLTGGLSLILMEVLDVSPESPLPYGIFIVSLSVGFLIYYVIIRKELK